MCVCVNMLTSEAGRRFETRVLHAVYLCHYTRISSTLPLFNPGAHDQYRVPNGTMTIGRMDRLEEIRVERGTVR